MTVADEPKSVLDVLDHLCAIDPLWTGALQIVQLAKKQSSDDPALVSAQLVCAIVLLASEEQHPQAFLEHCADSLRKSPLGGYRP